MSTILDHAQKQCFICKLTKPYSDFHKNSNKKIGIHGYCKSCYSEYHKENYRKNQDKIRERVKKNRQKIRRQVIGYYSKNTFACACCGEDIFEFLSIDHVFGGGNQHRKQLRNCNLTLYRWLRDNDFPDGYQVLCMNCNWGKRDREECPHKQR